MIIDCDTHFMPRDAFDRVPGALDALRPQLKFDAKGEYTGLDFPGRQIGRASCRERVLWVTGVQTCALPI